MRLALKRLALVRLGLVRTGDYGFQPQEGQAPPPEAPPGVPRRAGVADMSNTRQIKLLIDSKNR